MQMLSRHPWRTGIGSTWASCSREMQIIRVPGLCICKMLEGGESSSLWTERCPGQRLTTGA